MNQHAHPTNRCAEDAKPPTRYSFESRPACPGCGSQALRSVYRSNFAEGSIGEFVRRNYGVEPQWLANGDYDLRECADCTLVFQKHVGGANLLNDLYGHWVWQPDDPEDVPMYRADISNVRLSRDAHELMVAASWIGSPLSELRTFDYGMGLALWARIAAELGCQSYGTDLSQVRMDYAASKGVRTVPADAIPSKAFDFINVDQVLEHVTNPSAVLKELAGALSDRGILKVSVPNGAGAASIIAKLKDGSFAGDQETIMPVQPLEHVNTFNRTALAKAAAVAGLREIRPSLVRRYAFLKYPRSIGFTDVRRLAKELVRPVYQYHSARQLYAWFVPANRTG
jgi:2-polyprenyl-3-methyl-5-hydroxy-6-metoxy-1,4-benzoquinol methylase